MSNIPNDKVFDRAVDLIVHQDQMLQSWTTRYITIEGGLMFAVATLIQWRAGNSALQSGSYALPFVMAEVLIAVLGISATWLIAKMVEYELEWQKNYVMATKRAEGDSPTLYPFEIKTGPGRTLRLFHRSSALLTIMWVGLLMIIIFLPVTATISATP